jgi:cytochrome c peroxidase
VVALLAGQRRLTLTTAMRRSTLLLVVTGALLTTLLACQANQSRLLDADNPVRPLAAAPFGMEEFFEASPQQPVPARVRLGRWLFYDTRLSADGTVSCATCHRPDYAFSEPARVPRGVGGRIGRRRTPSLVNLAARTALLPHDSDPGPTFFWDGRVTSLEAQVLVPIADPAEMALDHRALIERLTAITGYQPYFKEAFGAEAPRVEDVALALADYVRTRMSGNAPYDRWRYARERTAVSPEAKQGSDLFFFKGRCAMCHAGFNFSDGRFHNLGVGWNAASQTFADVGRAMVTGQARDRGAFKTPGLRDVAKHPPYMHDGSFGSLREVVEFYNRGGTPNPNRSGRLAPLGLTPQEIDALVAFLHTLNGEGYADNPPARFPR